MTKMKSITDWRSTGPVDVDEAVSRSISPSDPYATSGELELMRHEIDRLAAVVGILASVLSERALIRDDELERLVDFSYEVTEG